MVLFFDLWLGSYLSWQLVGLEALAYHTSLLLTLSIRVEYTVYTLQPLKPAVQKEY
jgi:hypothetical protein